MPGLLPFLLLLASPPDLVIRRQVFDSTLAIHSSTRTAGAIDSLKFRGKEFVNAYDHGREWQSAVSYDGLGECLNPTEAGSNKDGTGAASSSVLIDAHTEEATLFTATKMAYWLQPAEPYQAACGSAKGIHAAQNQSALSDDTVLKQVTIGYHGIPNVIEYLVTLNTSEAHQSVTFEAFTGYMPPEFSLFLAFDPATSQVVPLSPGPGEQSLPVVLATPDRRFAAGVYAPELPQKEFTKLGYGRFAFAQRSGTPGWNSVKWNAVFRRGPVKPGSATYRCLIAIGTVEEVRVSLQQLVKEK